MMLASSCNQIGKITTGEIFGGSSLIVIPFGDVVITEGGTANIVLFFPEAAPANFVLQWNVSGPGSSSVLPITNGSLSIPAGATSAIINIGTNLNATYDGTRIYDIEVYSQDGTVISPVDANFIVNENLPPPEFSFALTSQNVNENAGAQTATVSMSPAATIPMTVNYSFHDGTATSADYTGANGSVTFNAGETSKTIGFTLIDDVAFEPAENFTITLDSTGGAATIDASADTHLVNIIDNEAANLSISNVSVAEGGNLVFTVTLSQAVGSNVTVDFATANGTALSGTNYTASTGTLTFTPGDLSETITISTTSIPAELCAANRNMTVTLSNPTSAAIGIGTGTGTISDPDLPIVSVANASATEGSPVVFVASLSGTCATKNVSFNWATATGTAAVSDFTSTSTSATITAGSTTANLSVATTVDAIYEGNETFTATLSSPTNATIGTATATGTINNDDTAPTLSINNPSVAEGTGAGTTTLTYTVTLAAASGLSTTIDYATSDGTATTADSDYTSTSGTLTIPAGSLTGTINVTIGRDAKNEPNETITMTLSGGSGYTALGSTLIGSGTINNDDTAPTISIANVTNNEGSGGGATTYTFTVTAAATSGVAISVDYATSNSTATTGDSDYTAASGTLTIPAGSTTGTFTVDVAADNKNEINETFNIILSGGSGYTAGGSTLSATGTITNDDSPPTIAIDSPSIAEGNGAGMTTLTYTVTLSAANGIATVVNYATSDGTATLADSDYITANSSLTIPAGSLSGTIDINVVKDSMNEADETITLTLSGGSGYTSLGSTLIGTGTITNDDTATTLSIANIAVAEGTGAGTTTFTYTVTLGSMSGVPVTVDYATSDNTATTADSDYAAASGTVTIPAGSLTGTFNVLVNRDAKYESNEIFDVTLSGGTNYTILGSTLSATGTINNDDTAPTISIANVTANEGTGGSTTTFTFTVTSSAASGVAISVNYATSDNTATTADSDYAATSGTATIPIGSTTTTFNVDVNHDAKNEANETFNMTLSGGSGYTVAGSTVNATGTITNDDALPTVQWTTASQTINENGVSVTITAQLSSVSGQAVSIPYTLSGTATGGGTDYSITASPLAINAGSTSANITVTIVDDAAVESNETVIVTIGSPTNATASGTTVHTVTIEDNDLGAFAVTGIRNTAGTDTTDDANLNLSVNARVVWGASAGATSYDVTIYENDGTTVKCALQNTASTTADFGSCNLTVNTNYKAKVTAKSSTLSQDATNSPFDFYVNRQPIPVNDGPMMVYHTDGSTAFSVLADNPATGANDPDADPDGQTLTITAVSAATKGTRTFTGTSISFDPTTGQNGIETLTYTVSDGKGGSATATLTIYIMTTKTWTGNVSALWSQGGNWCGSINGAKTACGAGAVPTSADTAIIDATCANNCDVQLDANSTVAGFVLESGSLTQQNGITFTVGGPTVAIASKKFWIQNGGTFNGGDSQVIADKFYLNSGTFTSTSGTFKIGYDLTAAGNFTDGITKGATAVFNHNSGKVHYEMMSRANCSHQSGGTFALASHLEFWNFDLQAKQTTVCAVNSDNSNLTINGVGQLRVMNDLKIIDGTLSNNSNIYVYGNLSLECVSTAINSSCAEYGDGNINMVGSGNNQTYSTQAGAEIANFIINKSSGSVTPSGATDLKAKMVSIISGTFVAPPGTLEVGFYSTGTAVNFSIVAPGAFDHNYGTLRVVDSVAYTSVGGSTRHTVSTNGGTLAVWNFIGDVHDIDPAGGSGQLFFGPGSGDTLEILNDFTIEDGGTFSGIFKLHGNAHFKCDDPMNPVLCASGGTGGGRFEFVGNAAQTITIDMGAIPPQYDLTLNKDNPSDTVTFAGTSTTYDMTFASQTFNDIILLKGTLDLNGKNLLYPGKFTKNVNATLVCNGGKLTALSYNPSNPCP